MKENHKRKRGEAICCNKCAVIFILYQSPVFTNMVNICSMIIFSMFSLSQKPVCNKLKTAQITFNSVFFIQIFYLILFHFFQIIQNFEVSLGEGSDDIQIMYEVFPTTTKAVPFLFKPKWETGIVIVQTGKGGNLTSKDRASNSNHFITNGR